MGALLRGIPSNVRPVGQGSFRTDPGVRRWAGKLQRGTDKTGRKDRLGRSSLSLSREEIRNRIDQIFETVLGETRKNAHEFVWETIPSVEALGRTRREAMDDFLDDYPEGLDAERYIDASLPELPFREKEFDLALCSHYLFLYSPHLSHDFHLRSIRELCRVAREVRIFPLLELGAVPSRHLDEIYKKLQEQEYTVSIIPVEYEFQRGGNRMMKVRNDATV